jgi:tetratricopeptide (TPR) repeat protein
LVRQYFDKALADARQAIALAPDLAEGHLALGFYLANGALDLKQALGEFERARGLGHGAANILRVSGLFAIMTGGTEAGLADLRRAVTLDPLSALTHHLLGFGLYLAHRYEEARAANAEAISLEPEAGRYHCVSILDDICAMGRHPKSARMARNRDAPARPGAVASADGSSHGSSSQRAALSGNRGAARLTWPS